MLRFSRRLQGGIVFNILNIGKFVIYFNLYKLVEIKINRHALDFRLNNMKRVMILDASHSLFDARNTAPRDPAVDNLVFQPIPRFREIISEAVGEGLTSKKLEKGEVVNVDVGVICNGEGVGVLTPVIHAQVLKGLGN